MASYRRLTYYFALLSASILLAVGASNYYVDPYGVWRSSGKFHEYNLSAKYPRLHKSYRLFGKQRDVLLIGNSRIFYGIDPNSIQDARTFINLALPAATHYENFQLIENFVESVSSPPSLVLIGLDIAPGFSEKVMHHPSFNIERFSSRRTFKIQETLLSYSALKTSLEVLKKYGDDDKKTIISDSGYAEYKSGQIDYDALYIQKLDSYINMNWPKLSFLASNKKTEHYNKHLEWIRKTSEFLKDRKIATVFFINPLHADMWQSLRLCQNKSILNNWKNDLVESINPTAIVKLLDFGVPNDITVSPLNRETGRKLYYEPSHYTPYLGDQLIRTILDYSDKNGEAIKNLSPLNFIDLNNNNTSTADNSWDIYDAQYGNQISTFCN